MIQLTMRDMDRATDILCNAFVSNKGINWLIKEGRDRKKSLKRLMEYQYIQCVRSNCAYMSDDRNGVILAEIPSKKKTAVGDTFRLIRVLFTVIGISRVREVKTKEEYINIRLPKEDFLHLIFIAVDQVQQNRGVGKQLLGDFLSNNNDRLPVYLETSTESNLQFYQKYGFTTYDTWQNPYGGFPVWLLSNVKSV